MGRGKKSARGCCAWCKQPEQLKFLFFVNKKWLVNELNCFIKRIYSIQGQATATAVAYPWLHIIWNDIYVVATRFKEYKSPSLRMRVSNLQGGHPPSGLWLSTGLQDCILFFGGLIRQSMETHTLSKAFSFFTVTMIRYFRVLHYPVDSTYVSTG